MNDEALIRRLVTDIYKRMYFSPALMLYFLRDMRKRGKLLSDGMVVASFASVDYTAASLPVYARPLR